MNIITDEMVEQAAEIGFLEFWRGIPSTVDRRFWCVQSNQTRELWIRVQRAALKAALSPKEDSKP